MPGASGFNANPAAGATDRELVFAAAAPRRSEEPPRGSSSTPIMRLYVKLGCASQED